MTNQLIIVMGVSGCGKSTVGQALAAELAVPFIDGDDLHPPANVARMQAGLPLDDQSRQPWLAAICAAAESHFDRGQSLVVACSALKKKYREQLRTVSQPTRFLFLAGDQSLILNRLQKRTGHFMPPELLQSQFADLQDPTGEPGVCTVDIAASVSDIIKAAIQFLREMDEA